MDKKQGHPELGQRGEQPLYSFQLKNQRQLFREKLAWIVIGLGIGTAVTAGIAWLLPLRSSLPSWFDQSVAAPDTSLPQALEWGMQAAELTQSAQLREDWIEVAMLWQNAISQLESVAPHSSDYTLAQKKIAEYRRNLEYTESNIKTRPSRDPLAQGYWTLGSDRELVFSIQGRPDQVRLLSSSCYETLHYGGSIIELHNGYVKSYDNFDNNLKVLEVDDIALSHRGDDRHWSLGASKDTVVQLQGTPDRSDAFQSNQVTTMYYGRSFVMLDQDRVIGFFNTDNNLKISMASSLPPAAGSESSPWSLGSSRLEVLAAQRYTPKVVSRNDDSCEETFHFGNSEVYFKQGMVTGYRNADQNLNLR
jgi:hypothetical protein